MSQLKSTSERQVVWDGDGPSILKEEQEDEVFDLNKNASRQSVVTLSSQFADKASHTRFYQLESESHQLTQNRPSVLRSTTLLPLAGHTSFSQLSPLKHNPAVKYEEPDPEYSPNQTLSCIDQHKTSSTHLNSLIQSEVISLLFVNGRCHWPDCDEAFEEYPVFLKHLNHGHSCGEKTIAQWRVQQERVRHMENQLVQEKQKLQAMQLHLRMAEHTLTQKRAAQGWWSKLALSVPPSKEPDGGVEWAIDAAGHQDYWPTAAPHLLTDFLSSMECYKHVNIRPPYTYAFLIRWSILESSEKQRALNEIYSWFTQMFFYFRHNTPTWKNAVRHNLSLHKCFVRVDGEKGAVWTVDEKEFQKRKGQKFNRESLKWLASFSHISKIPKLS